MVNRIIICNIDGHIAKQYSISYYDEDGKPHGAIICKRCLKYPLYCTDYIKNWNGAEFSFDE